MSMIQRARMELDQQYQLMEEMAMNLKELERILESDRIVHRV